MLLISLYNLSSQMLQSMQRIAYDANVAREAREAHERNAESAQKDEELNDLRAARKAAEAAAQLASLEQHEIELKINMREQEKERLRIERQRLEDEVRKSAAEAESVLQRENRPERSRPSLERVAGRTSGQPLSADTESMMPSLVRSDAQKLPSEPVDLSNGKYVEAHESRVLKVDGRLSDILSGIDKLLLGGAAVQQAEKAAEGRYHALAVPLRYDC